MKKAIVLLLGAVLCIAFIGCTTKDDEQQEETYSVYTFYGENEQIKITNGVIILDSTEDVFYGGNLEGKEEFLSDISEYSLKFYIINGEGKEILFSTAGTDLSGETLNLVKALHLQNARLPIFVTLAGIEISLIL